MEEIKIWDVIELVRQYVRQHHLTQPGDRIAVAVSGGADSVALLRVMLELRHELGVVLSAAHFHHGIRGDEADADRDFVRELGDKLGVELHLGAGDVPAHARAQSMSLETAARELRHAWFARLTSEVNVNKVATAHTLDDQAETVLMHLLRGAGTRGLAGIFPVQQEKHLIRPLLNVSRRDVEDYLRHLGQTWREDSTNLDLSHTRNRVRHRLLPMLEQEFNPAIRRSLADLAETARAESEYWDHETATLLARVVREGKPSRSGRSTSGAPRTISLDLSLLTSLPLALERHLLQQVAAELGSGLEFVHIQQLGDLIREKRAGKRLLLPEGVIAVRSHRELQFTTQASATGQSPIGYQYRLSIPGETRVPELGSVIHARIVKLPNRQNPVRQNEARQNEAGQNPDRQNEDQQLEPHHRGSPANRAHDSGSFLNPRLLSRELVIRNWRAGDKFFPARTRAPKKLKELLQPQRLGRSLTGFERKAWPVVESDGEIVWVRGFAVPEKFSAKNGEAVLIEENVL